MPPPDDVHEKIRHYRERLVENDWLLATLALFEGTESKAIALERTDDTHVRVKVPGEADDVIDRAEVVVHFGADGSVTGNEGGFLNPVETGAWTLAHAADGSAQVVLSVTPRKGGEVTAYQIEVVGAEPTTVTLRGYDEGKLALVATLGEL
jgi:hypothetical protein